MAEAVGKDSPLAKMTNLRTALEQIEERAKFYASKHKSETREGFETIADIARKALDKDGDSEIMRVIESAARRTMQVLGGVKDALNAVDKVVDGIKSPKKVDKDS